MQPAKKRRPWNLFILILFLTTFTSCSKDEHVPQIVGFSLNELEGYSVYVEDDLRSQFPTVAEEALRHMALQLSDLNHLEIKTGDLDELRRVIIFLENAPSTSPNGAYYQIQIVPGEHYLRDQAIIINNPQSFILGSKNNAATLLHEMAHAFHHQVLGFNHQQIREAYENAMELDLYKDLYATENYKEYFAELTTTFYNKGRYRYPSNRNDLQEYDSLGFIALRDIWLP